LADATVPKTTIVELTADIASAYVCNNSLSPLELPPLIQKIFGALTGIDAPPEPAKVEAQTPAVSIRKSLTDAYLICLEDGRQFKSLKRHLRTKYNMTPDDYRAKWGLPQSYPMVAPAYALARSALAKQAGLGQRGRKPKTKATRAKR
jgi:predicted transcriptional regulator